MIPAFLLAPSPGLRSTVWRWPVLLAIVASIVWIQSFWFYQTRRWLEAWRGGRSSRTMRNLHRLAFALLIAAIFVTAGAEKYRMSRPHRWFSALMSLYFIASYLSGYLLLGWSALLWMFRRRDAPATRVEPAGSSAVSPAQPRRVFVQAATAAVVVAPVAATVYGLLRERLDYEVRHVPLSFGPKAAALRGRSIAQISDIHIGPYLSVRDVRRAVDEINSLGPDLVFLTGDFVTFRGDSQYDCVRELSRLRPRTAVFGCLGNHEIYTRTEASISRLFAAHGFPMLRLQGQRVQLGAGVLNVAGIDFFHDTQPFNLSGLRSFTRAGEVNILLTHNPNAFDHLGDLPFDLCISGHTHGGQLRLEFINVDVTPARLMTPYISGMFERAGRRLYVNRGLGTIGVPIRLGARPEITIYHFV